MAMRRRYPLSVSPQEAIERLERSDALARLRTGRLHVLGQPVEGQLALEGHTLTLSLVHPSPGLRGPPPKTHVVVELEPSERGASFRLRSPSMTRLVLSVLGTASLGALAVAVVALISVPWAILELMILGVVLGRSLWKAIRSTTAYRRALVDVVWQAWSPALAQGEGEGYRALAPPSGASDEPSSSDRG